MHMGVCLCHIIGCDTVRLCGNTGKYCRLTKPDSKVSTIPDGVLLADR